MAIPLAFYSLLLVFGLVLVAEWRKDAIYHLLALIIIGLTAGNNPLSTVNIPDDLGIPRLIWLALGTYQVVRMANVFNSNRNILTKAD